MKRRISVEQLQELTYGQKQKLNEWWKPQIGDVFLTPDNTTAAIGDYCFYTMHCTELVQFYGNDQNTETLVKVKYCIPLLDIGQMIELLESKDHFFSISKEIACDDLGCLNWGWLIEINTKESPHQIEYMEFSTDGLADCLWKAVKTIL